MLNAMAIIFQTRKDVLLRPMQFNDTHETPPLNKIRMLPSPTSSDIIISKAGPGLSPTRQTPHYGHNNPQDRPGGSGIFWKPSFQYQSSWDCWSTLAVEQLDLTSPSSENEYKGQICTRRSQSEHPTEGPSFIRISPDDSARKAIETTNVGQRNIHKASSSGIPREETNISGRPSRSKAGSIRDIHCKHCDGKISTQQPQTMQSKKRISDNKEETSSKKGRKSCIQDLSPSSNSHFRTNSQNPCVCSWVCYPVSWKQGVQLSIKQYCYNLPEIQYTFDSNNSSHIQ